MVFGDRETYLWDRETYFWDTPRIYTLLFHSLEFDIQFNIANSSQYQGTASASITLGVAWKFYKFVFKDKQIKWQRSFFSKRIA